MARHGTARHHTARYHTAQHHTAQHRTARMLRTHARRAKHAPQHCIARIHAVPHERTNTQHVTARHGAVLHCAAPYAPHGTTQHGTARHCIALHRTAHTHAGVMPRFKDGTDLEFIAKGNV